MSVQGVGGGWEGGGNHSVHEAAETPECVRVVLHYCVDDG